MIFLLMTLVSPRDVTKKMWNSRGENSYREKKGKITVKNLFKENGTIGRIDPYLPFL